jgi:hypothetical protein
MLTLRVGAWKVFHDNHPILHEIIRVGAGCSSRKSNDTNMLGLQHVAMNDLTLTLITERHLRLYRLGHDIHSERETIGLSSIDLVIIVES